MPIAQTQQRVAEKDRRDSRNQELFCIKETPLSVLLWFFRLYQPSHNSCHNPAHKWHWLLCRCFFQCETLDRWRLLSKLLSPPVFLWRCEATGVTRINIKANLILYCLTCGTTYNSHPKTDAWFNWLVHKSPGLLLLSLKISFRIFSLHRGDIWNISQLCGKSNTVWRNVWLLLSIVRSCQRKQVFLMKVGCAAAVNKEESFCL